jgi:hypothetical protein
MPFSHEKQFHRTQDRDGSWASFCIRCLRTVACDVRNQNELAEAEAAHRCEPATLARLREKQGRL